MAARFTPTQLNAFKRTLLPRLPACFFTAADVDQLQKETGVDGNHIHLWAEKVRERVLREDRNTYLSTIEKDVVAEIDCEKVKMHFDGNMLRPFCLAHDTAHPHPRKCIFFGKSTCAAA
jgi:hypothetical protein